MSRFHAHLVPISETGTLSIPSELRRFLGLNGPGQVVLSWDEGGIRISSAGEALDQVRALARPFRPTTGLVSDMLIEDRRREAVGETTATDGTDRG